jgi:Domain of unknown function (DUF4129)
MATTLVASGDTAGRAAARSTTVTALALAAPAAVDPDQARDQAREILDGRRYKPAKVPRPFEGVLEWLGDRLRPIGDFFSRLAESLPGKIVLGALLAGAVVLVTWLVARQRAAVSGDGGGGRRRAALENVDPGRLERDADAAERKGDLDLALRLRFRAGLLRLDRKGAIRFRPSMTSGQVARQLRLRDFDNLAIRFDAVAYGGRQASATDVESARATWPRVVEQAGRP